uniref:CYCLIN domain-containing protein n=1 Tax=Rhabditophanes sp. KR3021 TaxID=114890 RepID=A0AC35TIL0_9BILA
MMQSVDSSDKKNSGTSRSDGSRKRRSERVTNPNKQGKNSTNTNSTAIQEETNESFSENSAKRHCADNDILSLQCEEDYSDDSSSSDIKKVIPPTKGRKQMSKGNSKKTAKKLKNAESAFIFKQIDYDIARIQIGDETQVVNKFELIDRYSKDISLFGENLEVVSLMFEKSDIYPRAHRPGVKSVGRLMGCHRRIIVDWMMEVATVEKLSRTTLHMAVDYIDRAFALKNDFTDKLYQTIAGTCLLIAAKIEEIYPPTIDCFVRHGGGSYTDDYLRKAEVMITGMLGFALHPITAVSFLDYFYSDLQNAIFDSSSNASTSQNSQDESSIDESGFFTQAANAPRGSGIFEEEIITNEERYNPDINPLNPLNRTNKGGYSPEKGEYWAEFGEDLHPDLLRAYLKSFAVLDFVTLTYPSTLFGSRELAAGIIFAQFKEDEGMPTRVLGFTAEDAKRAIHFVEPFFARIDEAQAEYYENYTSLSNRYYDSTRHKIQIYSKKLGEMLEPIEGQTNPLLKHVESFSTI